MAHPESEHRHHILIRLKRSKSHGALHHAQMKPNLERFQLGQHAEQRRQQSEGTL